jgi:cytochrome c biogenesis protein CcmG/thiol:disulfide interchange protein DsbE
MTPESQPHGRSGRLLRGLGLLAALGFLALLGYGLIARAPDTTIDDALAARRPVAAPGFDLGVLANGRPGRLAPAWQRATTDGRVKLTELRGTPIVLNFWASWCDPCRAEAPILERGWKAARPQGVMFLGLDMQDVPEDALGFIHQFGQDYPSVRDPTKDSARRWGVTGIPETFFISRRGDVVGHVIGTVTGRQLADGVRAAINGRPRDANRGGDRRPTR